MENKENKDMIIVCSTSHKTTIKDCIMFWGLYWLEYSTHIEIYVIS